MIVISGKYRGKKLKTLEGMNTRPTSARVKEDMFNILNNYFYFENKISLDLFGGSGALSIEGLSRGIKHAYINDHYLPAINVIKNNLINVPLTDYTIFTTDYDSVLTLLKQKAIKVDLIYLDPPFPQIDYYYNFFQKVIEYQLLNQWGVIMTEASTKLDLVKIDGLELLKFKDFKNKYLYIFRMEGK